MKLRVNFVSYKAMFISLLFYLFFFSFCLQATGQHKTQSSSIGTSSNESCSICFKIIDEKTPRCVQCHNYLACQACFKKLCSRKGLCYSRCPLCRRSWMDTIENEQLKKSQPSVILKILLIQESNSMLQKLYLNWKKYR